MNEAWLVAAEARLDVGSSLSDVEAVLRWCERTKRDWLTLTIDPLRAGWNTPREPDHFRSGCGPIEALAEGARRIRTGEADVVLISGVDDLRSGYTREERHELTSIFGRDCPLPQAYDALADEYRSRRGWSEEEFRELRDRLFENCLRSYLAHGGSELPDPRWYDLVTRHFRGVDCANPVVDFRGGLVVMNSHLAREAGREQAVRVAGVALRQSAGDGPDHVEEIARYDHLDDAFSEAEAQARVRVAELVGQGRAVVEAYTCYPVVPLAFLSHLGLRRAEDVARFLEVVPLTVTGGLNLARAPWNNPALRALVAVVRELQNSAVGDHGVVHGNGGLGQKQGVAILERVLH